MATTKLRKDTDVVRYLEIERFGEVQAWKLTYATVKNMSKGEAKDFEDGFAERARDFNQGRTGDEREVPAASPAWWKGYRFAQSQETVGNE
jgi:hypothetical protein